MKTLSVGEIKANFSEVLERVKHGEKIAVGYGKQKKKVAVIVPYDESQPQEKRKLGALQGKGSFAMRSDFPMTDEEILAS